MPVLEPERWKRLYNLFDPTARVEMPDQDLFVTRPGSAARTIFEDLKIGLEPEGKWVVCGSMGSGKSSELVHLGTLAWNDRAVIGVDLPRSVARVDRLQAPEALFLMGAAAIRAGRELWGYTVSEAATNSLVGAFGGLLSQEGRSINVGEVLQGVAIFAANLVPGVGAAAVGAASGAARVATQLVGERHRLGARLGGLTRPVREGDPDVERLVDALDAILAEVAVYRPPLLLVDGLDKLTDLTTIRDLFGGSRLLSRPRCPIVYTGPITLMLNTEWQPTAGAFRRERLVNIVVRRPVELAWVDVKDDKIAAGRAALRQIVHQRLRRVGAVEGDVFVEGAFERLLDASGGLVRDLIHLVNRAIRAALRAEVTRIDAAAADSAIEEIRKEVEITLTTRRVEELVHVRANGEPSGAESSSDLLLGGYVLPYGNGRVWFEPHPILAGLRSGL